MSTLDMSNIPTLDSAASPPFSRQTADWSSCAIESYHPHHMVCGQSLSQMPILVGSTEAWETQLLCTYVLGAESLTQEALGSVLVKSVGSGPDHWVHLHLSVL